MNPPENQIPLAPLPDPQVPPPLPPLHLSLFDVLIQHQFWWANHSSIGSEAHCRCGKRPRDYAVWIHHIIEVLLSLPDITITGLPAKPRTKDWSVYDENGHLVAAVVQAEETVASVLALYTDIPNADKWFAVPVTRKDR